MRAAVVRAEAVKVEAVVRVARLCAVLHVVSLQSQNDIGALGWELWCEPSAHRSTTVSQLVAKPPESLAVARCDG